MSKKLRVFFLSALVVMLAVSSAFAAALEEINVKFTASGDTIVSFDTEHNPPYYIISGDESHDFVICHDGNYILESSDVKINSLTFANYSTTELTRNVVITIPAPVPDVAGNGTGGKWTLSGDAFTSLDLKSTSPRFNLTIDKAGTHGAIHAESIDWTIPAYVNFTVNAPFRVKSGTADSLDLAVTVKANGVFTFEENATIFASTSDPLISTGFVGNDSRGRYIVEPSGQLIVKNQWAIKGSSLSVDVQRSGTTYGTLTIDIPESTLDLKGRNETSGGATINAEGNIDIPKALTLVGSLHAPLSNDIHKTGAGVLTLSQKAALSSVDIKGVYVNKGGLVLSGSIPVWEASNDAVLQVSNDATFAAGTQSIRYDGTSLNINLGGTSVSTFKGRAIYKGSEIYPYGVYFDRNNGLTINVDNVAVDINKNATLVVDGPFALSTLTGDGTVEMSNVNASEDRIVLIFTSPDLSKNTANNFEGTITGNYANVGLYATAPISYNAQMFASGDFELENLIVYGPAILAVDEEAKDNLGNVNNIWLRGHRPGAPNYNDNGSVNTPIATSGLTVGGLLFTNITGATSADVYASPDVKTSTVILNNNIKIDGTSNAAKKAVIQLEPGVHATIGNIQFYANREVDFYNGYVAPATGIHVLTIDGSDQPSRLVIDGMTVSGDGVAADVANTDTIYQVEITDKSDVRFLGDNGKEHYPLGKNNSLYVGKDAKLEMARGAIIDGHITFAGSSNAVETNLAYESASGDATFPKESWFEAINNTWNSPDLDGYSTFTTVVARGNRMNGSLASDTAEYAVKVTGDITFSTDVKVIPSQTKYPGRVLVRTKTHTNAFDGIIETTLQRFKTIGTTGTSADYAPDFVTVYNPTYLWRVTPFTELQVKGVVVENRAEFALLKIGDFAFTRGADTFGQGEFAARADVTAWAKGEQLEITSSDYYLSASSSSRAKYELIRGNEKYYIKDAAVYFRRNIEGEESAIDNVFDESAWSPVLSSGDILMRGEFRIAADGTPELELRGRSYGGYTFVDTTVMLVFTELSGAAHTLTLGGVIPAFKEAPLSPGGLGDKFSKAQTYALEPYTVVASGDGNVSFVVVGIQQSAYTTTSSYELVNGNYKWNVKALSGAYLILNENGDYTRIQNLRLVRYKGTDYTEVEPVETAEDPVITFEGDRATVTVPVKALGDTGEAVAATIWLALMGDTSDGKLITAPVAYTLLRETKAEDIISNPGTLSQTVQIGGDSVAGKFEIDPALFSGDVTLQPVNLPAWLGYNGGGNMISYQTGNLANVDPRAYTFQVIAYNENYPNSHKLYTFTVTVVEPEAPGIYGAETMNVVIGETATLTLRAVASGDATVTWAIAGHTNPEGLLTGSANGLVYTLTANAADVYVAEGSYVYTITAGGFSKTVTVNVSEPEFTITAESNTFEDGPVADHMYTAVFSASGAQGEEVVWRLTDNTKSSLYSFHSGDLFVVEGVAKVARDADDNDEDQTFRVVATAGNRTVEEPIETTFTVEADETTYTALAPAAGSHTAVDASYVVNFPANVTAEVDTVFLPSWLEPVLNDDGSVIGIKFSKVAGELANGTQATVRIEATDNSEDLADDDDGSRYYGWEVMYNAEPEKLTLTLTPAALTVAVDAEATSKASVTNALGNVRYTLSKDAALTWVTISGDVVTVSKPTTAGSYTVTVVAQDDRGVASQATQVLTITVTDGPTPPAEFSITATPATVTFTSPTASAQTVTLSTNFLGATVTYSAAVSPTTGLTATVSGDVLTLTPSAAGTYVVTVTGTNGTNTATATVNVTVNSGTGPTPAEFSISVSRSSVTFDSPTASAQTVTLSTNFLGATVTYSAAVSPATGLTATVSGTTLTLTPSAAGTYVVTVTGTNGTRTATATVNVTVSSGSTPTTFSISASPATVTFTSVSAAAQTVTLSATNASGSVNYTAEVTASSTGSTGLTDGLDLTVSGNTLTIDPLEAGTYTVTITGNTTTQTATTTITVVVTSAVARVGSSGGGCDAGFGALALVLAAPLFLRRRRS